MRSLKENLDTHWRHVEQLCKTLSVTDIYRALKVVQRLVKEVEELKSYINEVCSVTRTDNIGNALKRIKGVSVPPSVLLPSELQRIPQLWLEGRAETRKQKGVLKMTFFQAERQHRRLLPYLEDAWKIAGQRDSELAEMLREQILQSYEETSADDMMTYCYAFVNDYELDEEEEMKERETEETTIAELLRCAEAAKFDYGVTSREQFFEEQK